MIDNDLASSVQIGCHLARFQPNQIKLTKIRDYSKIFSFIQQNCPNLIFFVVGQLENRSLIALSRINQVNLNDIPIILFTSDANIDLRSLPLIPDNCLSLSEVSPARLERTIFFALERSKQRQELRSIRQENMALNSQLVATRDLFRTIVDNTSTLVWTCDQRGKNTFLNQAWSRVLGQDAETKLDSNWMLNIHPQDFAACEEKFHQALANGTGFTISYRLKSFDQKYRWISNYAVPQFTLSGEFKGLVGYCFDITAHKNTEQKLIQRAASDRLIAQITQKIHASLDLEQILQTTVDEAKQFLMVEKIQINLVEELDNLTLLVESRLQDSPLSCDISEPKQVPETLFQRNLAKLSAGQIVTQDFSESPSNLSNPCSTLLIPIICETKLWGLICMENCSIARQWSVEEINFLERIAMELSVAIKQAKLYQQLEKANRELQKLSVIDSLTQIANRRKFDQYIAAEWIRLSREKSPLSLILCDIDYFKLYNDTYGHQAGDLCLKEVAQAISKVIKRPSDLLARYGGEEFVIILPKTPLEGARYLAQQIRLQVQSLKIPHFNSAVDLYVTISLGVSCCTPHPDFDFEVLIAAADQGLYQAKERGRNQAVEFEIEIP